MMILLIVSLWDDVVRLEFTETFRKVIRMELNVIKNRHSKAEQLSVRMLGVIFVFLYEQVVVTLRFEMFNRETVAPDDNSCKGG